MLGRMLPLSGAAALPLRGLAPVFAALLHHREYRRVWFASLASNIGSWMQTVALGWLVYKLSGSALWLGIYGFASQAPMVALLPLGGVLADRLDRRRILGVGSIGLVGISMSLAMLHAWDLLRVWHLIAVAAANGCLSALLIPANQSLLPRLVQGRNLPNAVALNSLQFNLSRLIGPALGGVVMVSLGATWSFLLNAATFLPLIVVLWLLPASVAAHPHRERPQSVWESLRGGLAYLRQRPDLLAMESLVFVGGFAMAPLMHMLPAFVRAFYGGNEGHYSTLLSSFGAGAVLGAVSLAARSSRGPTPWRALPLLAALGMLMMALAFGPPLPLAMLLIFLCGACFVGSANRLFAAILSSTPDRIRGRVSSLHVLFFSTGLPLGSLLAGTIARSAGVGAIFACYGALITAAVLLIAIVVRVRGVVYQAPQPSACPGAGLREQAA